MWFGVAIFAAIFAALLIVAAAVFLRPPPVEPFSPTSGEARQLALYQRPESWFLQHLRKPRMVMDQQALNPKFQYMIERFGNMEAAQYAIRLPLATALGRRYVRARVDRFCLLFTKMSAPMRKVEDRQIPGRGGPIPVRIYWPDIETQTEAQTPLPILVYAHGGGYVLASIAALDRAVRLMANEAGVIIISVDYRLTPEYPYPAAGDDSEDVFLWARANAEALGGDSARVAFGGDSAGGHIAINVAQRQLHKNAEPPAMLLLYYPAAGLPYGDRSYELFGKGFMLDASLFDYFIKTALQDKSPDKDAFGDLLDPLHAESLKGMPPTILATAGFDILRDSGRAFAERLQNEGIPVIYRNYPSLPHCFLQFSGIVEDADKAATETAKLFGENIRNWRLNWKGKDTTSK